MRADARLHGRQYEDVHRRLGVAVPEFGPAVAEHLESYDELLPRVSFGDLTRFIIEAPGRAGGPGQEALQFLDGELRTGEPGAAI